MFNRIFYAIKQGSTYRNNLRQFQKETYLQTPRAIAIDLKQLQPAGIKILAIDLDGVLVPFGEIALAKEEARWLQSAIDRFGAEQVFIYSNKLCSERKAYFLEHFPSVGFVEVSRKKPYPDGLSQIMEKTRAKPEEILVIDDRLLTGILAAVIVGAKAKWIQKPIISLKNRPFIESYFILLRALERFWLR